MLKDHEGFFKRNKRWFIAAGVLFLLILVAGQGSDFLGGADR